jgi:multidrug efflux pump subunit AcrA (membrane-fusion protein)
VVTCLAALFLVGLLPRLARSQHLTQEAHAAVKGSRKVGVVQPLSAQPEDLVLPGSTQAIQDALVGARTTGVIKARYVDIGSRVRAGQVLALIESPDIDAQLYQANAQTAQSRSTVQQARADVFNKQALIAQARSTVHQAEAAEQQASAGVADAQARLLQLSAAVTAARAQLKAAQHTVGIKEAALAQARTSRNLADVTNTRYQTLYKQGFVAAQDVDQYHANLENAVSAVNSAQSDLSAAQAAVEAAQEAVTGAQANEAAGRADVVAAQKSVAAAAATVAANQSNVEAARANLRGSQSNVSATQYAERATVANASHYSALTGFEKVVAPFDGVITARNVDAGALVNTGTGGASASASGTNSALVGSAASSVGLFGLSRTDVLRLLVSVPAVYAREIHPGLSVAIDFDREFPGRLFRGTVARASGAIDSTSRTLLTEVHIDNRRGELLPGMFGQVHFALPRQVGAVRVPAGAVTYDAFGTRVATLTGDNRVHYVPVKVGRDYGETLEITQGLTGRETLIASPSPDMAEGEKMTPVMQPAPGKQGP